jgi:hypothetical protein
MNNLGTMNSTVDYQNPFDFPFPTNEERLIAYEKCPKMENFGFKCYTDVDLIFHQRKGFNDAKRFVNLFQWDLCLTNKIGKLTEAYVLLNTSFLRLSKRNNLEYDVYFFFEFHTEIFYYLLFSTRDMILQIINVFYLKDAMTDSSVSYKTIQCKLKENHSTIFELIESHYVKIKSASKYRHSFTHRYPVNFPDYRAIVTFEGTIYSKKNIKPVSEQDIMLNANESLLLLDSFISDLRIEFARSHSECNID